MTSFGTTTCDASFVPNDNSHGFKLLGLCRATGMRVVNGRLSNTHHLQFCLHLAFLLLTTLVSLVNGAVTHQ